MSISLSDVRYRAHQAGDVPNTYPGHQTNKSTGPHKIYLDNVKYRAHQNVVWFEDDIAAAPNIPFDGRTSMSITGAINNATDSWEGYDVGTVWAKFKAPVTGLYTMTVEVLDGEPTTIYQFGDPMNGFVPNIEIWLPFTSNTPTSYADIEDFVAWVWPPYVYGDEIFNLIAGRTYYILAYSLPAVGQPTPEEENGSFVINLSLFDSTTTATAPQDAFGGGTLGSSPRGWIGGQNVNSNSVLNEPIHPQGSGNTVWFLWQNQHYSKPITFQIEREWGAEFVISVYTGNTVTALTLVGHSSNNPASVTFTPPSNFLNYRIQVDSKDGQEGGFILSWNMEEPIGNRLSNPINLGNSATASRTSDTTNGADADVPGDGITPNSSAGEEDLVIQYDADKATIWYEWEAPADGWATVTGTRTSVSVEAYQITVFSGDTYEELIMRGQSTFIGGSPTRTITFPAKQGAKYKIRVDSTQVGITYDLNVNLNTSHTPVNINSPGEFSHTSEGSFSRFEVYAPGNPYAKKTIYISWKMKYGDANKIELEQLDWPIQFGRLLNSSGALEINLYLNQSVRSWRLGNNTIFARGLEGGHVTQEWTKVELIIHPEAGNFSLYTNGRLVGSDTMLAKVDIRYLDLGYLDDAADRPVKLHYKDLIIRDIWNRDFDYRPEPSPTHNVKNFEGYSHGLPKTGSNSYEDWSGYYGDKASVLSRSLAIPMWISKGTPENTSRGRAIRMQQGEFAQPSTTNLTSTFTTQGSLVEAFGAWIYLDSLPTGGVNPTGSRPLVGLTGSAEPGPTVASPSLNIDADGNLYVRSAGSEYRKYLKRRIDTGRWHYLEVVLDSRYPSVMWKIYLNGELIFEGIHDPWIMVTNLERSQFAPTFYGVGPTGSLITDMVYGQGYEGKLGPFKTALIKPNSSVDLVHNGDPVGWWKSTDDGATATILTLGDQPHTYVDQWPYIRNFEGTPAAIRLIGQDNTFAATSLSYVEFGFEDMPSGEDPVALKVLQAYRGWDKVPGGGPPLNDYEVESASDAQLALGVELVSQGRESRGTRYMTGEKDGPSPGITTINQEAMFLYDYGEIPWTESLVNGVTVRWGFGGGAFAGAPDYGGVLNAIGIEVLMRDTYPALAPYSNLYPPDFEWLIPWLGGDTSQDIPPLTGTSQTSCDAYDKRSAPTYPQNGRVKINAVDPYIRGKVLLWLNIMYFGNAWWRDDVDIYWRLVPAYDQNYPGFDGDFHDTDLDRTNGTTSNDMLVRWLKPYGYDWNDVGRFRGIPDYPPNSQIKKTRPLDDSNWFYFKNVEDATLLYDPCFDVEKGKIAPDRTVKIQAYAKDAWGNSSSINEFTFTFPRGNCCGHIVVPIKYRAKQAGDVG